MDELLKIAAANQQRAREVIRDTDLEAIWQQVGAEPNLVGSLRTGLLMTHRDIDFHIYSSPLRLADSFAAMARLAENSRIRSITFNNLLDAPDQCLEWHAWYADADDRLWQIDMIHMPKGSAYDGYFERVADRIAAVLTDRTRETILRLKYETPEAEKIMGIEYYQAVLRGIRSLARRQPRDGDPGVDALTKSGAPSCKGRIGTGSREQGRQWRSTRRRYRAFNTVHRAIRHPRGTQRMTTSPQIKKSNPAGLLFSIGDGTTARLGRYRHGLSQPGISCW